MISVIHCFGRWTGCCERPAVRNQSNRTLSSRVPGYLWRCHNDFSTHSFSRCDGRSRWKTLLQDSNHSPRKVSVSQWQPANTRRRRAAQTVYSNLVEAQQLVEPLLTSICDLFLARVTTYLLSFRPNHWTTRRLPDLIVLWTGICRILWTSHMEETMVARVSESWTNFDSRWAAVRYWDPNGF